MSLRTILIIQLIILGNVGLCQGQQVSKLVHFDKSECRNSSNNYCFSIDRIVDSTFSCDTLKIEIAVTANCGIGNMYSIEMKSDTLFLMCGNSPGERVFCDCNYNLSYTIAGVSSQKYIIYYKESGNDKGRQLDKFPYTFFTLSMPEGLSVNGYKQKLNENLEKEEYLGRLSMSILEGLIEKKTEGNLTEEDINKVGNEFDLLMKHYRDLKGVSLKIIPPNVLDSAYMQAKREMYWKSLNVLQDKWEYLKSQLEAHEINWEIK